MGSREEEKPPRTSRNRRGRWGAARARDGPVAVERQPGFRAHRHAAKEGPRLGTWCLSQNHPPSHPTAKNSKNRLNFVSHDKQKFRKKLAEDDLGLGFRIVLSPCTDRSNLHRVPTEIKIRKVTAREKIREQSSKSGNPKYRNERGRILRTCN